MFIITTISHINNVIFFVKIALKFTAYTQFVGKHAKYVDLVLVCLHKIQ